MVKRKEYRLFIDERGNHHMSPKGLEGNRYLTLLGVVVSLDWYHANLHPALLAFKRHHFSSDVDQPVILHHEEVIGRRGVFEVLKDPGRSLAFNCGLIEFYRQQKFGLIAVTVDKIAHKHRYGPEAAHPYHYCARALLERYVLALRERQATGDVFAESRGPKENAMLQASYEELWNNGSGYVSNYQFKLRLRGRSIEFRTKPDNTYGLQVADMLVPYAESDVLNAFGVPTKRSLLGERVCAAIQGKYRGAHIGIPKGYGQILLSAEKTATASNCQPERATTA